MLVIDKFICSVVQALELFPAYDPEMLLVKYRQVCKSNGTKLIQLLASEEKARKITEAQQIRQTNESILEEAKQSAGARGLILLDENGQPTEAAH